MVADPFGAREPPLDGDADLAAGGGGDRERLPGLGEADNSGARFLWHHLPPYP